MPKPTPRSPITLEQLLRLKRSEKPDAEFWQKFEVELRQKQLAALVERRSWWRTFPRLLQTRGVLPLGATAVLAFTFVSIRYQDRFATEMVSEGVRAAAAMSAGSGADAPASLAETAVGEETGTEQGGGAGLAMDDRTAVAAKPLSQSLPEQAGALGPWGAPRSVEGAGAPATVLAVGFAPIEEMPADVALTPSDLASLWEGRPAERPVAREATAHALEIAAVSAVASRRNRLLAQFSDRQFTPDPMAPEVFRERIARRLADAEQTGGWTRVGVRADRVSLKF